MKTTLLGLALGLMAAPGCLEAGAGTTADIAVFADTSTRDTSAPNDTSPAEDLGARHDVAGPVAACEQACTERLGHGESGFCLWDHGFDDLGCVAYCERDYAGWNANEFSAFETCATTDPLCYQTISDCMMRGIYGEAIDAGTPIEMTVRVYGDDFAAYDGAKVVIAFEQGTQRPLAFASGVVTDGAFEINPAHIELYQPGLYYWVRAYIDLDGQPGCGDVADLGFQGVVVPRFGTSPLRFEIMFAGARPVSSEQQPYICDAFDTAPVVAD